MSSHFVLIPFSFIHKMISFLKEIFKELKLKQVKKKKKHNNIIFPIKN